MLASKLFKLIEKKVPPHLALKNDKIGYLGDLDPDRMEVNKVQVSLDLLPNYDPSKLGADLLIIHHPPLFEPEFPVYVIHSHWDIVKGGANDALAECLKLRVTDVFDVETGIGRICSTSITFEDLINRVSNSLPTDYINMINCNSQVIIEKVAIVSGFGLKNPEYIKLAHDYPVDLFLSGDLNHQTAMFARKLGVSVVDATHYATEIPGLIKLGELINEFGVETLLTNEGTPWKTVKI
ncbi:MAG: Nif3-like dinuclear metal center hexameric protein [Methanobacterium sp.]|nr:Nif3-like dinuclear metal center hexameric protein [Methanobacterium sp.]